MKPAITIGDVARHARVSVGTVSNVLNGRSSVKEERRARVLRAIQELGYSGSLLAKGMRAQRYPAVGLCVPHTSFSGFSSLVNALEAKASHANYEVFQVVSHNEPERELARIQRLVAYKISGMIILPSQAPSAVLNHLAAADLPTVLVRRAVADDRRFDQVTMDNRAAMYTVVKRLIELGHRRILFFCQFAPLLITEQRIEALDRLVAETAGEMSYRAMECGPNQQAFRERLSGELSSSQPPSVVVVANGMIAGWAIKAFRALSLNCPQDLSLFALDEPDWAELVTPQLSSVRQPTHEMTQSAWDLLRARMQGEGGPPQHIVWDGHITFRESVARPARRKLATVPLRRV